jgi:hypothetical protein
MAKATRVHSTPPLNTPILHEAAGVLDELAAGIQPDRARLIAAALALDTLIKTTTPSRDLRDAAAGLQILATGGTLDLDKTGRNRALRQFASSFATRSMPRSRRTGPLTLPMTLPPKGPTTKTRKRFASSTSPRLIALLRYAAALLGEAGAPGLPIEVPFAGRWSAAFGTFCAHVANSLAAIVTAGLCSHAGAHRSRCGGDRRSNCTAHR